MHFRNKLQAAHERHMSKPRDRADRPPSTAWLAAQEAFSAPRPVAMEPAPVVLRKGRAAELSPPAEAPAPAAGAAAAAERSVERPARVFRVVTATSGAAASAAGKAAGTDTDTGAAMFDASSAAPASSRPRRKRRVDLLKHPGPVRHIVQALPAPVRAAMAAELQPSGLSTGEEIASLWAEMARLDAVLSEIARAQSFRFVR